MLPQTRQSLIPQTAFFHYEISKSLEMFFSVLGIFFANFGPTEVKDLLNFLAMPHGFCRMVLSTLISWGRRFDFGFCFPVIYFITCQVRLEFVFM